MFARDCAVLPAGRAGERRANVARGELTAYNLKVSSTSSNKVQKISSTATDDTTELESSAAPAEWPEEQRSCTRRRWTAADAAESSQHWVEGNAYCILNSVTIVGAG